VVFRLLVWSAFRRPEPVSLVIVRGYVLHRGVGWRRRLLPMMLCCRVTVARAATFVGVLRARATLRLVLAAGLLSACSAPVRLVVLVLVRVRRSSRFRAVVACGWRLQPFGCRRWTLVGGLPLLWCSRPVLPRLVWVEERGRWAFLGVLALPTKPHRLGAAGQCAPAGNHSD
jgi:hypothetical protein